MERFNVKKLNGVEVKEQCQDKISNRFAALGSLLLLLLLSSSSSSSSSSLLLLLLFISPTIFSSVLLTLWKS
jgi:hypothetical protein